MAVRIPRAARDRFSFASLTALGLAAGCAPSSPAQRDDSGELAPTSPRVQRVSTGAGQMLIQVEFADALRGFAVGGDRESGSPAALVRTSDGGQTWARVDVGADNRLYDVQFPSRDIGFACGLGGCLLRSADAGRTWSELAGFGPAWVVAVHFLDETRGIAAGESDGMFLAASADGGTSWRSLLDAVPESVRGSGLRAMHFVDGETGIASGHDGLILRTTDGGATWERRESGTDALLKAISFPSHDTGYVAGAAGAILRTDDAGSTWRAIQAPERVKLNGVAFVTAERGVLAAAEGGLWSTEDGGASWSALPWESRGMAGAHATADGVVWVCAQSEYLLRVDWPGESLRRTGHR